MKDILEDLVETPGVSGDEKQIRETVQDYVEGTADSVETDTLGNLIARKGDGDQELLIAAHMDQIGLRVKQVSSDGYIYPSKVGGVTRLSLPTQRVTFYNTEDDVTGVVGTKPPHLMSQKERNRVPSFDSMCIDIGAESAEDVYDLGIDIGEYAVFDRDFEDLENNYVTGPALDNRVGCTVGIEAFNRFDPDDHDYELVSVFSTQEEVGLKGAGTATYEQDPDVALAVDTSIAGDTPTISRKDSALNTGEGPVITLQESYGRGLITTPQVEDWLRETAEQYGHNHQLEVGEGGRTDAAEMYVTGGGIHTGSIGVPTRYIHSATEVVKMDDLEATADYLDDTFESFDSYF